MRFLPDTHLPLWAVFDPDRSSRAAVEQLSDAGNTLHSSPVSRWEIVIGNAPGRPDFSVDPRALRRGLPENDCAELPVGSQHVLAVGDLPDLHRDPFDRLLVAQANAEGFVPLTADSVLTGYGGSVRTV